MNKARKSFIEYHTSILEREINELKEEVVYWISHKYIRDMEINELYGEINVYSRGK